MGAYWNQQGKHQATWIEMFEKHVPGSGNCPTVGGEAIRAANKLYYDGYNNGFCNNTSGPAKYLIEFNRRYMHDTAFSDVMRSILPKTNTGGYSTPDCDVMDAMIDKLTEFLIAVPELLSVPNHEDMYEYSDDDYYGEEDEDLEWEDEEE
jgi:hypothetical protein